MTKTRKIRITKPQDVRRLLAETINEVRNADDISKENKARLLATLSNSALRAIEQGDLADRLDEYEKQLAEQKAVIDGMRRSKR